MTTLILQKKRDLTIIFLAFFYKESIILQKTDGNDEDKRSVLC